MAVAWEQKLSGVITSRPMVRLGCMRTCWRANGQGRMIGATGNCDSIYMNYLCNLHSLNTTYIRNSCGLRGGLGKAARSS
jgi:hypothetical protein